MQKLEENVSNPTTVEELQDAIKKYSARVEDVVSANAQIGVWYKLIATRYVDKKMYGEALETFKKALEFYPNNQNLHYYVGLCAGFMAKASYDFEGNGVSSKRQNYLSVSENAYLTALQIEPNNARTLYALGVLYTFGSEPGEIGLNLPQKAIPYLERYVSIETKDVQGMFILARCYYATYETEKAINIYEKIISTTKSSEFKAKALDLKNQVLALQNE